MSTEASGAPATAAPTTTELSPAQGAPETGVVVDPNAQPAAPTEGEGQPAQPTTTATDPRSPAGRIAHYSKQAREAELRAAKLEGENEALRRLAQGQPAPATSTPEVAQPTGPVRPDFSDRAKSPLGDIDPQYHEDLAEYLSDVKVAKALEARDKQAKDAETTAALTARIDTAAQASEAAGFPEGATFLREAPVHIPEVREIVDEIATTTNAGHVAAYFAKHVDQFKQVALLPARERLRAIDNLDRELGARLRASPSPSPQPAPASAAPNGQPAPAQPAHAPTPTISGAGGAAPIGDPPVGDMVAYRDWRAKAFG